MDEVETLSKKRLHPTLENDASVETFATKEFGILQPSNEDNVVDSEDIDVMSTSTSVRDPQRSSAPKQCRMTTTS